MEELLKNFSKPLTIIYVVAILPFLPVLLGALVTGAWFSISDVFSYADSTGGGLLGGVIFLFMSVSPILLVISIVLGRKKSPLWFLLGVPSLFYALFLLLTPVFYILVCLTTFCI